MNTSKLISILSLSLLVSANVQSMQEANEIAIDHIETVAYEPSRDLHAVSEIFKRDWPHLFVGRPFDQAIVDRLMILKDTDPEAQKFLKVARLNQQTIGFATYYFFEKRKEGYLEVGALAPEYRSKGIAKHFFPKLLEELKQMGAEHYSIFVKKDNAVALSLYQKFGFEIIEETMNGSSYRLGKKVK